MTPENGEADDAIKHYREDPRRVLIIGAGRGGSSVLEMLLEEELVDIVGVVEIDPSAPGLTTAKQHNITIYEDFEVALKACAPCVAFNLTHNEMIEHVAADLLGAGAVVGGMEAELLYRMFSKLQAAKDELNFQAMHDHLTGLYNRRRLLEEMEKGLEEASRYKFPYSVALLDLDRFKSINDTYGHEAGDTVLKEATRILRSSIRNVDTIGRWGGEEFVVLLPHTHARDAMRAARHWLANIAASPIKLNGTEKRVTFSAGVACYEEEIGENVPHKEADRLLALADQRLYQAKQEGRQCIIGPDDACERVT
ncbi:MAG TPA: GGDEF domain-containing protein [Mariprofundaceae bacterium]|nr:GGDEF domain-containing protein [Mariprofundaceae bacterium]